MKEIERCYLCQPSKFCEGIGERQKVIVPVYDGEVEVKKNIACCPTFRKALRVTDVPKLINQNTGEPYDKL